MGGNSRIQAGPAGRRRYPANSCYPAGYLALALLVLNKFGRHAPYYFLNPATVGTTTVTLNVAGLAGCVLAVGYALLAAHRAVITAVVDVS